MPITTRMTFTPNLIKMAGLSKALKGAFLTLGPHFSETLYEKSDSSGKLHLHCKQLAKSNHVINGVHTNSLYVIPFINQTVIQYTPKKAIYLPIEQPTRYLQFKLLDQNSIEVPVKNVILQLLNKQ